jgi:hypothetical protein
MHGPGGARAALLTESLAKSIDVHVSIKPATFVFKIGASAQLVELGKALWSSAAGRGGGGGGAAAMPRARARGARRPRRGRSPSAAYSCCVL